jgi:hypothetical protein
MEIKDSLENALSEIDALRSNISELSKRKDIHQIELDLLLQKLRELYDFLRSLEPGGEMPAKTQPALEKSAKNDRKTDKVNPLEQVKETSEEVNHQNEILNLVITPDEDPMLTELEKPGHLHSPGKTETKHQLTTEKTGESKKSVHELYSESAQNKQSHIGKVLHSKPIHNIEDAIGVNDKFLFIRELFNSNASRYKETIDALNNAADFNSAYSYIEKNFEWDSENEAAQKLLELVRRRHISHKNG